MLGVFIATEKQKGLAVDVDGELGVRVAMSGLPELRGSEQDPAAVLVQVGALGCYPQLWAQLRSEHGERSATGCVDFKEM